VHVITDFVAIYKRLMTYVKRLAGNPNPLKLVVNCTG